MALSDFCMCWPPGPEERKVSIFSELGSSRSSVRETLGKIATVTVEV